jgi:nucleotide-binding universal stress UspA family protein
MLPNIQTIIYATDLEEHARPVFRHAVGLAERYSATIVLLHVIEPLSPSAQSLVASVLPEGMPESLRREGMERVRNKIEVRLNQFCEDELGMQPNDCRIIKDARVVEGRIAATILSQAADVNADVIVMGTHGRTGVSEMFLGSVAHQVVHRSRLPVFLVPLES